MIAFIWLFYWVIFPWLVYKLARWTMKLSDNRIFKRFVVAVTLGIYIGFLWIAVGRNMWLDHQVRQMCAKDGGVKVYETVELTPDLLDGEGKIIIPWKNKANSWDKYYMEIENSYFRKGSPRMYRSEYRIIRRNDGKVLGQMIRYHRGGGGLPGPWHPSGFSCPSPKRTPQLEPSIFIKGDKK